MLNGIKRNIKKVKVKVKVKRGMGNFIENSCQRTVE